MQSSLGWNVNIPLLESVEKTEVTDFVLCCFENKNRKEEENKTGEQLVFFFCTETFKIKYHTRDYSDN